MTPSLRIKLWQHIFNTALAAGQPHHLARGLANRRIHEITDRDDKRRMADVSANAYRRASRGH